MRTFSCFTFDRTRSVPALTFIMTSSLHRARELARRELLQERAVAVEICEGQQLLWTERAEPVEKARGARSDLGSRGSP